MNTNYFVAADNTAGRFMSTYLVRRMILFCVYYPQDVCDVCMYIASRLAAEGAGDVI